MVPLTPERCPFYMKNPLGFPSLRFTFCFWHLLKVLSSQYILDLAFNTLLSKNWSPFVWNFDIFLPYLEVTLCLCLFRVNLLFSSHLSDWVKTFVRRFKGLCTIPFDLWVHLPKKLSFNWSLYSPCLFLDSSFHFIVFLECLQLK